MPDCIHPDIAAVLNGDSEGCIITGDCLEIMADMPDGCVDAVVTSPPYAMQRKKFYGGIPEGDYPAWTVRWALAASIKAGGSICINIRENIKDHQISDYVLLTRLAMRRAGWFEAEELIWIKPDSPCVGAIQRPRRAWERVLWFSNGPAYCDPKANGQRSERLGMTDASVGKMASEWVGTSEWMGRGQSRCRDYFEVGTGQNETTGHPAAYPVAVPSWVIKLVAPPTSIILDPFAGSGTTCVAAKKLGRRYIGIEIDARYCEIARNRVRDTPRPLFSEKSEKGCSKQGSLFL